MSQALIGAACALLGAGAVPTWRAVIGRHRGPEPLIKLTPGTVIRVDDLDSRWRLTEWDLSRGPLLNGTATLALRMIPAGRMTEGIR